MKDQLRQVPWWQRAVLGFLLAAGLYALTVDGALPVVVGVAAVLASLATLAGVALQVRNPFEARPKPHLTLQPVDGEEMTSFTVDVVLRPVDVDAVVEEALELARALATSTGLVAMTEYAKPTEADHDKFERALTAYADDVRAWAEDSEAWLRAQVTALVADVVQHNPTSIDATDAGTYLFFPPGTVEYEETEPPEAPDRPAFPRRRSALSLLMDPASADPSLAWSRPSFSIDGLSPNLDGLRALAFEAPVYEKTRDGGLEVFYGRWAIRHREPRAAGEPFSLTLPPGEHQVRWRVYATNLPEHVEGVWTLSVRVETGTPIKTTGQLDAALQGKPEVTVADRQAILRRLREGQASARSDSSTASR